MQVPYTVPHYHTHRPRRSYHTVHHRTTYCSRHRTPCTTCTRHAHSYLYNVQCTAYKQQRTIALVRYPSRHCKKAVYCKLYGTTNSPPTIHHATPVFRTKQVQYSVFYVHRNNEEISSGIILQ